MREEAIGEMNIVQKRSWLAVAGMMLLALLWAPAYAHAVEADGAADNDDALQEVVADVPDGAADAAECGAEEAPDGAFAGETIQPDPEVEVVLPEEPAVDAGDSEDLAEGASPADDSAEGADVSADQGDAVEGDQADEDDAAAAPVVPESKPQEEPQAVAPVKPQAQPEVEGKPVAQQPAKAVTSKDKATSLTTQSTSSRSGVLSNGIRWTLSSTGVLTVTGSGKIPDYGWLGSGSPWAESTLIKKVVIGEGITRIGSYSFRKCKYIKSISLPLTLREIGTEAFSNCESLASLSVPSSVTSIEQDAFIFCESMKTLVCNASKIGLRAFRSCSALTTVKINASTVGSYAFEDCENLKTLTCSAREIGAAAFNRCASLSSVTLYSGLTSIGAFAFDECAALTSLSIPATVTTIDARAFASTSLRSVTLPESVRTLYYGVFANCKNLTSVVIKGTLDELPNTVFEDCHALKSVTFKSGVKKLSGLAFQGCSSLATLILPSGLTTIAGDYRGFYGCDKLKVISLPSTVASLDRGCFHSLPEGSVIYAPSFSLYQMLTSGSTYVYLDKTRVEYGKYIGAAAITLAQKYFTYNGYAKNPGVTVTMDGMKLYQGSDYSVRYSGNVRPGVAKVIIEGLGYYGGKVSRAFYVKPKAVKIKGIAKSGSKFTVSWSKSPYVAGYKVYRKVGTGSWKLLKSTTAASYVDSYAKKVNVKYSYTVVPYSTRGGLTLNGAKSAVAAKTYVVPPKVYYSTHIQNVGWQSYRSNGKSSGTSGKALRLEGIKIKLSDLKKSGLSGGISYCTQIQNIGWQGYRSNGKMSGTSGKALRLEAIRIKLTGAIAKKYDVIYRVHSQNFGWMGWAKNGKAAGTSGYGYRLEAIQIKLVAKGTKFPAKRAYASR